MVFQHSALYPHLTVRDNVAFSLRARRASRGDVEQKVARSARDLGIDALLDRFPGTLSGGQAQRVALARAMVRRPKALLLDEPLASLDAPLRWELRSVLRQAHQREPLTTIYVTHDQEEALALADRLVVLRAGRIEQVGASRQVYEHPANRFVAGFVGSPRMNLMEGTLARQADQLRFEWNNWWLEVPGSTSERLTPFVGQQVTLGLRPQELELAPAMTTVDSPPPLELVVRDVEYCGDRWLVRGATTSGASLVASMDRSVRVLAGDAIRLCAQADRARFFAPGENGRNLLSR
jgi:multiple sugar transport system ATP-binding protein